jgi:tungstate transport system permease protein
MPKTLHAVTTRPAGSSYRRTADVLLVWQGIIEAIRLLVAGDPEVWRITLLSLQVSGGATLLSLVVGIPCGTVLALARFPGRAFLVSLVNTGMGLPPVVVGLFVTILLWRNGALGPLELLYTPAAMVIAQLVIAAPIVTGLTLAAVQQVPPRLGLQMLGLGASRVQMVLVLLREARLPMLAAVMAGFGGVISEVGASMMVGGNIRGSTRVLTTATVLETGKGNFDVAIALSLILLAITFLVNWALTWIQQRRRR